MYIPKHFCVNDQDKLFKFMKSFNFGILVTSEKDVLDAAHIPFLIDRDNAGSITLVGHLAKENGQWCGFDQIGEVLVIFNGPHSYISPSWYKNKDLPPTWNYSTVHAYGSPRIIFEKKRIREFLCRLTLESEKRIDGAWSIDLIDSGLFERMREAIVVFEIKLNKVEGKWKMSQNRRFEDAWSVAFELDSKGGEDNIKIAAEMRAVINEGKDKNI